MEVGRLLKQRCKVRKIKSTDIDGLHESILTKNIHGKAWIPTADPDLERYTEYSTKFNNEYENFVEKALH